VETRAVFKTWRVGSVGTGYSCGRDDCTGDYRVRSASEREGRTSVMLCWCSILIPPPLLFQHRERTN